MMTPEELKSRLNKELSFLLTQPLARAHEELGNKLKESFPEIFPVEIGPSWLIHSFKIVKGRDRVRFFTINNELVDWKAKTNVRGNRRLRKWARTKLDTLVCAVVFQPVVPLQTAQVRQLILKEDYELH